jgi:hypothetical protein
VRGVRYRISRTIHKRTYRKWIIWLVAFASAFLSIYIIGKRTQELYPNETLLPLFRKVREVVTDGSLGAVLILVAALLSTLMAMLVSVLLTWLKLLEPDDVESKKTETKRVKLDPTIFQDMMDD